MSANLLRGIGDGQDAHRPTGEARLTDAAQAGHARAKALARLRLAEKHCH
ncbi:hypothetical protein GCM10011415_22760 [Salipiger pallidus]|uniref:Uncharacterized protein n=1 Tax=Salipiger pallidus TaxID=1775170 RepID=A0A8J2ZJW5_9RHOB|nr:hypothetical protein [Salipiger pallidus]GGG73831.1 hypothetical protein GCM10011415_22760 [Salipiger pallidus]